MAKRYLRISEAIAESGVSRRELLDIARTPGQTLIHKMTPGAKNSPLIVDMAQLGAYMDDRARASFAPRRRLV